MKELALPETGGTARIGILDATDLGDVLALQDAARAALPDDKKLFALPQSAGFFQNFLTRQTGSMIGMRVGGKLVACMIVMGPLRLREAIARRAITNNDVPFHHAALTDSVVVFANLTAHPDWGANDPAKHLVSFALDLPVARMVDHVFAQIATGDKRSWDVFARGGFGIVGAVYDPQDNQPRFIFQKPAFGFDCAPAIIADDVDPREDFTAIINLTQREALVGVYEDGATEKLAFLRNREASNLMPVVAKVRA